MRFCIFVLFCFRFSEKEPRAPVNVFDWMDISQLPYLCISIRRRFKKKNYRVLAGVPSSLSWRARIRLTLPLLLVAPAMQAMTFAVKQVSSAKSTLKLNTDQNPMSSICESNIVITKSQLVSMLLMSRSLLGSTAMVSTKPFWVDLVVVLDTFPIVLMKHACDWVESFPEFLDFC